MSGKDWLVAPFFGGGDTGNFLGVGSLGLYLSAATLQRQAADGAEENSGSDRQLASANSQPARVSDGSAPSFFHRSAVDLPRGGT